MMIGFVKDYRAISHMIDISKMKPIISKPVDKVLESLSSLHKKEKF